MRLGQLLLLIVLLVAAGNAVSRTEPARPAASPVASCSASGCHGGTDIGKLGSEVTTWNASDPHSKAYSVLFNDESQRIIRNLRKGDENRWQHDAHLEKACLACHATGIEACYDGQRINAASDGVGCDACHGNSERWLIKHFEPGWKSLSRKQKLDLGFTDTKDLVTRTSTCSSCHVGDKDRDVNHDLIAAGHPRLAFDYARFDAQEHYRKHWTEKLPRRDYEIRSWFIGQVAALRAAAVLTADRAAQGIVPELTEQSCFACHQKLTIPARGTPNTTPQWQPWHVALLTTLIEETPTLFPGAKAPALVQFPANSLGKPLPREERRQHAVAMSRDMDRWLEDLREHQTAPITEGAVRRLAAKLATAASRAPADYDCLAPYYLALAALHHADPAALTTLKVPLETVKAILKYNEATTGPAAFDAAAAKAEFAAIAKLLTP